MPTGGPATLLMHRGKRNAATVVRAECAAAAASSASSSSADRSVIPNAKDTPGLCGLLDSLLNPDKAIDDWETLDWCRWLVAGGSTPEDFASIVRGYDNHAKCGLVWIPHVVAYRCRTCGISPCMSICRDCFRRGDHSTHDFNMFLSQAGGACDCGDTSVMKEDGFCSNHGINNCASKSPAPTDLMCVAEAMMPRIILRLLQYFRENSWGPHTNSDSYRIAVQESEGYVSMLMEFNNMGELMRKVMTKALIDPKVYESMVEPPFPATPYGKYLENSKNMYERAVKAFPSPDPPDEYKHLPALGKKMKHTTLLEEFIFWTFKYEFPQNVVCFLLNMLPDQDYKEHLTRTFVMHYARIPLVLELSADPDMLSNRVVHMSVQLFSNEALALRMVNQLSLLHVMVISLKLMMTKILIQNTLHDQDKNCHYVIDCAKRVMKEHCYWPLVSDFNNVLSHKSVALVFLKDYTLIDMWFEFLSMLQGMNVNVRELVSHVEFEPSSYYAAFSCELEASAYPMWSIISHLTDSTHADLAKILIRYCINYLNEWLNAIFFIRPHMERSEVMRASFHFPLHRYLAAFINQAVRHMGVPIADLLPETEMLMLLMMHPLRVQSLFYEILSGIWVRNGLQIKGQAMTYIQANFCNSMVDMDIYFLQVCASHLPHTQFLDICINTFGVMEWLSMAPLNRAQEQEQDAMVEGFLTFLAMIVSSRTNLGNDELTQSRLEISTLLATGDKTHSQLLELMPERSGNAHTKNFETVLKELSYYRAPPRGSETLEQGQFAPRATVWSKHYDPLHVLQRAVHRKDFLNSMERFTTYVQSSGLAPTVNKEGANPSTTGGNRNPTLWPPLRLPNAPIPSVGCDPRQITRCGRLHAALLAVLHRAAHRCRPPPEHVLALAVFLLEVAVDVEREAQENNLPVKETAMCQWSHGRKGLLNSFPGDRIADNARITLSSVALPPPPPPSSSSNNYPITYDSDSDTEWDAPEVEGNAIGGVGVRGALAAPDISEGQLIIPRRTTIRETDDEVASALMMHDYSMTEGDQLNIHGDYQLALPSPDSVNTQMSVVIQTDMSMVPTTHDVSEVFPNEGGTSIGSTGSVGTGSAALCLPYTRVQPAPPPPPPRPGTNTNEPYAIVKSLNKGNRSNENTNMDSNAVPINESIISLLLKLHSQLSGCLDSFSLDDENSESAESMDTSVFKDESTSSSADCMADFDISTLKCDKQSSSNSSTSNSDKQNQSNSDSEQKNIYDKNSENRIGDGPYFIGNLLHKLCKLDKRSAEEISRVRANLWPRQRERQAEQRAREQREREERTRRARERQRTVMQEFVHRQNAFMKHAMETDECAGMEWQEEEEEVLEKEYDCSICNITSPSTESNPMGLVVLLQSTSVIGHRRRGNERPSLPLNDSDKSRQTLSKDSTLAADFFKRHHIMDQHFDSESWQVSVNVGWEGGVHVQSCGHHIHLGCLQAYLRSLTNPQRPHNLHIERGEFLCPVCRQLANSVLPLSPQLGRASLARCQSPDSPTLVSEILNFLKDCQQQPNSSKLSEAMVKAMEDMANSTQLRFKQRAGTPNHQTLLLFVSSVARTNLEAELVQRGGTLAASVSRYKPRQDCIVPLLHVLAVHARVLAQWSVSSWWNQLTIAPKDDNDSETIMPSNTVYPSDPFPNELVVAGIGGVSNEESLGVRELPLLLKDPIAILIHFLLLAPLHLELPYLTCMVRVLFNLTYYQVVAQLLSGMKNKQRDSLRAYNSSNSDKKYGIVHAACILLDTLCDSEIFVGDDVYEVACTSLSPDNDTIDFSALEKELQQLCLPFLRISALLRHHLYGEDLPEVPTPEAEFFHLVCYLDLVNKDEFVCENFDASYALKWCGGPEGSETALVTRWATGLEGAATRCPAPSRRLLTQHCRWAQPALLRLPRDYDRLFTYYHERICNQCGAVPKEASVCLLCGTVICLKQQCCRQQDVCEAVAHSIDCGGGTGIFLVVTSTYIIIVRGRRACLWGSLYLDDYDEEDRDLKRGKPLYLSEDRFELLEQQWLSHRFDHTKRTWVWHRDSL